MARMKHPELAVHQNDCSLERSFAKNAAETLYMYAIIEESNYANGSYACYKVTDSYIEQTSNGQYCGLRLRSVVVIQDDGPFLGKYDPAKLSDQYKVIMLEQVDLGAEWSPYDSTVDADLDWQEYVLIVINDANLDDVTVLDANGVRLSYEDLTEVDFVLGQLRAYHADMLYEEDVDKGFEIDIPEPLDEFVQAEPTGLAFNSDSQTIEFVPGRFIVGLECPSCSIGNNDCGHKTNQVRQN